MGKFFNNAWISFKFTPMLGFLVKLKYAKYQDKTCILTEVIMKLPCESDLLCLL